MRSAPTLTLAVATVATALAGTRRSHRASGRASTRRMAAPHRRTQVMGSEGRHAMNTRTVRRRPGAGVRRLAAAAACLLLAAALDASANEEPVSAFAASVGARDRSSGPAPAVTVYVVPEDRTFLLTDILVANHGQEVGPLYLADSQRTRCSVELLETMLMPNNDLFDGQFSTLQNAHVIFSSGIPFGPGEPVIATLAGGSRGVDVTITGKLLPAPRWSRGIRLPGGARADEAEQDAAPAPRP